MARPPELHDAVGEAIEAVDSASTVWGAELIASELLGRDWIPLPLGRAVLIDVHLRQVADEAAQYGGHGRTLQAILGHLTDNPMTKCRVNLASRALGVLQPWVPLLDGVELVEARQGPGVIVLHFGYRTNSALVDEHNLVVTVEDGIVQRIDVTPHPGNAQVVDAGDLAPRLATIMAHTTRRFRELRDPDAVNGPWALLTSRVLTCLPPVLSLTPMTEPDVRSLGNRFVRLKATKRLAEDFDEDIFVLKVAAWDIAEYERRNCPGGWTVEDVDRCFAQRVRAVGREEEELLEHVLLIYLTWRIGKLGYGPAIEAARQARARFLGYL